jgi:ferric-dicitrate binding protein FerR (iron transport regulator)
MNHHQPEVRDDDAQIEHLLREVGERVQPTPEISQAVRAAVYAEWQAVVVQRTRRKQIMQWSMAASVAAIAVSVLLLFRYSAAPVSAVPMASIVKVQSAILSSNGNGNGSGTVQVSSNAGATWRDVIAGEMLSSGTVVRTDPATRVALDLGKGVSVRLDAGTYIALVAAEQVRLERGRIYIDASPHSTAPLTVHTAFGVVEHLGTQYQVQLALDRIAVSVREGRVAVAGKRGTVQLAAGERLSYSEQGEIGRDTISQRDSSWEWAMQTAPLFDIDNHSLASFLDWVARETGRTVVYATPAAHAQAEQLVLRGSVANLTPEQALRAVLATTQFTHADTEAAIKISL